MENQNLTVSTTKINWPKVIVFSFIEIILFGLAFITGLTIGKNQNIKTTQPTKNSAEAQTPTPTNTETDWNTFYNEQYQYQIKYPKNWTVNSDLQVLDIEFPGGSVSIDSSNSRKITEPINEWITKQNSKQQNNQNQPPYSSPITTVPYQSELNISEEPVAIDNSFFGQDGTAFIFSHRGTIFYISTQLASDSNLKQVINQILSTFKFTDTPAINNNSKPNPKTPISFRTIMDETSSKFGNSAEYIEDRVYFVISTQGDVANDIKTISFLESILTRNNFILQSKLNNVGMPCSDKTKCTYTYQNSAQSCEIIANRNWNSIILQCGY